MKEQPLRTTVIGSYPFPSWLEFASQQLDKFGVNEIVELQEDAVIVAIHDQVEAGLDVITDGEQSRLDFNLSFYGYLQGIKANERILRVLGPPDPRTVNTPRYRELFLRAVHTVLAPIWRTPDDQSMPLITQL